MSKKRQTLYSNNGYMRYIFNYTILFSKSFNNDNEKKEKLTKATAAADLILVVTLTPTGLALSYKFDQLYHKTFQNKLYNLYCC